MEHRRYRTCIHKKTGIFSNDCDECWRLIQEFELRQRMSLTQIYQNEMKYYNAKNTYKKL